MASKTSEIVQSSVPIIVVAAYNRPESLARLLSGLGAAVYSTAVKLIISIDGGGPDHVPRLARDFEWRHGDKHVIRYPENLGLKEHILKCGDLTQEGAPVLILEDDLFVAKHFFGQSFALFEEFGHREDVDQISLYSPMVNEFCENAPFQPIDDTSPVYLMRTGSSWGQMWTPPMWSRFRRWLDSKDSDFSFVTESNLPRKVRGWPTNSWKKLFNAFLVERGSFVVYPKVGLTTNVGAKGTNHAIAANVYNTPLATTPGLNFSTSSSPRKYDQYMEPILEDNDVKLEVPLDQLQVDFYGTKEPQHYPGLFFLTRQECKAPLRTYQDLLLPELLNIQLGLEGEGLSLCRAEDVVGPKEPRPFILALMYRYKLKYLLLAFWKKLLSKLKR